MGVDYLVFLVSCECNALDVEDTSFTLFADGGRKAVIFPLNCAGLRLSVKT